MKRVVSLCFVCLLLMISMATAENSNIVYWSGDWRYRYVTSNTVEIAGFVGDETTVTLPAQLSGMKVVRIGDRAFSNAPEVTKVIIPNGITSITEYAFEDSSITTIQIAPGHPTLEVVDGVVYRKTDRSLIYYPPHLPYTHYDVKGGTRRISTNAFHGCLNLCTIDFPLSLTTIEPAAITWCDNLTEIVLPERVVLIDVEGFANNSALSRVTVPASVTEIGMFAFSGCSDDLVLFVEPGSYAEKYATEKGYSCSTILDADSELPIESETTETPVVPGVDRASTDTFDSMIGNVNTEEQVTPSVSDAHGDDTVFADTVGSEDVARLIEQRNALYLQLVEEGITPCIDLSNDPTVQANTTSTTHISPVFEGDGYEVTNLYQWEEYNSQYIGFSVRNTSETKGYYVVRVVFFDENNNIVGVHNEDSDVCDPGQEIFVLGNNDIPFARFELNITQKNSSRYDASEILRITTSRVGNKIILIGDNVGTVTVKFPKYYCLYLSGDTVVGYSMGYLGTAIEAGESEMIEISAYKDFDQYVIYVNGYYK